MAWLQRVAAHARGLLFLLLLPLRVDVLREAVLHAGRLPLLGALVSADELTSGRLADSLRGALVDDMEGRGLWARVEGWKLPPPLRSVARAALVDAPREARAPEVLRLVGVRYECARRAAARAGLPAPRCFAETLHLLRAVCALRRSGSVQAVAQRHGFADADHLRERLRLQFLLTPTAARALGPLALLDRVEAQWFPEPQAALSPA